MPLPNEGEPHDREILASYFMTPHPDPRHTPLTTSDLILFVDEPYCKNEKGNIQAGYAITTKYELPGKGNLPQGKLDQQGELHTLTRLCQLSRGQIVIFIH